MPKRFFDLYDPDRIALPLVKEDDLDDVPEIGRRWALSPRDHELVTSRHQWRYAVQGYLASISYCDHVIGEIVTALDASGFADDTAIVFWGDNGFHLGEKLHWRKFVLWEEATRVPLIVVPPRSRGRNGRVHEPVSLVDIFPTILQLCEVPLSAPVDGESLVPFLPGTEAKRRKPAIMTWGRGNHSVRTSQWRLTRYADGAEELYDHQADPHEWTNLALISEFASVRQELSPWIPAD